MNYIIGLDQGTTGTTVLLLDEEQHLVGKTYREHRQYFPKMGWVEHDPEEIFQNVVGLISEVIQKSGIQADQIRGIGITNQRETTVVWNHDTQKHVHPAIVWQCRRTSDACERLKKKATIQRKIRKMTGLTIDPYFSATKLSWILQKIPNKNIKFGTIDSWLIYKLTKGKVHVTDPTNASRTLLFDIHRQVWSKDLCALFRIPMDVLPNVQPSMSHFGFVDPQYFGHRIPILGVAGDQQASLFGHGAVKPFQAKCTFGTGAFALVYSGEKPILSKHGLLTTLACNGTSKSGYALEGSIFMAGSIIQWLRDEMKMIQTATEMDPLATSLQDNGGVYLVPAFAGLGAPHWKPHATANITGMRMGAGRAHIARAALEAIAYQVYDLLKAIEKDLGKKIPELNVDGGVTNSAFLMQFLSDLLQIPIHKNSMTEMTAFGAANLAGSQSGIWKNPDQGKRVQTFLPRQSKSKVQPLIQNWQKAVQKTLKQ